jgi:hypothetical protein
MSRGPGTAQVRVLEALDAYRRVAGPSVDWEWKVGGSFARRRLMHPDEYEDDRDAIEAYKQGRRIEIWMLRRDTKLPAPELSRALHSLYKRNFVVLYGATLEVLGSGMSYTDAAKFARISGEGVRWLSANKVKNTKLALNRA